MANVKTVLCELIEMSPSGGTVEVHAVAECFQGGLVGRAVMHGNGQPALVNRVQQNADRIDTLANKTQTIARNCVAHRNAMLLSRNQVIVALIGLIGAGLASCASLVVTLMKS